MPYNFLKEYLEFNSGNECPKNYHVWSALCVLAASVHKQVHVPRGYFDIWPNLYVCLVGMQGSRKSTAKDIAADLFMETFPDYPVGASVQSREDIIKFMCSAECLYSFPNEGGVLTEVRPLVIFINELKNFLSVDPGKMIEFLTDIYDRRRFKSGTIKRGLEDLVNPCLTLLACETPEWIIDKLKAQLISGGFARRMVYVYEIDEGPRITFPERPKNWPQMWERLKAHLLTISKRIGPFHWEPEARTFLDEWYQGLKFPDDILMRGYYKSKDTLLLKVAMLLTLAEEGSELVLTTDRLLAAMSILDVIEVNMPKLSSASGRNELAVPMQTVMELLEKNGGIMPEKTLRRLSSRDLSPMEQFQVFRFMQETDQIFIRDMKFGEVTKRMVMTPEKYKERTKGK